ncbi:MAG: Xaa-Pro dipeptidase [Pseudomonadales bacterium]
MNETHYEQHLQVLAERWAAALTFAGFDAAVVAAGEPHPYFLDDQAAPFRPNPHFAQWFPDRDCAHAMLLIRPGATPRLFFHQPRDYWHQPPALPAWAERHLDVAAFAEIEQLQAEVAAAAGRHNRLAFVGEREPGNLLAAQHNPTLLLQHLHYHRAYKTEFEIDCMVAATERAVAGHLAARDAFFEGASEFDTHMRYLAAARQTSQDLPYPSIVAQNQHAGVLHYQHYDRQPPQPLRSFLIDAGATAWGYASDITRTYAAPGADAAAFAALIEAVDTAQQALIADIRPGLNYVDLHDAAHRYLGQVLVEQGLVRCSAEAAFDSGLTRIFLPHGVGHLIGLQTHDVGGQQTAPEGGMRPPPSAYPALRLTRDIAANQVFTIEPGLYFIPMLLEEAAAGPAAGEIHWERVNELRPFGGIRIEDNVVALAHGVRNLTREAFARHG